MITFRRSLMKKFEELQAFHHKTLHELADAAQIIKSYEYLDQQRQQERELLDRLVAEVEALCSAKNWAAFTRKRGNVRQAIDAYRAFVRNQEMAHPYRNASFSSHSQRSKTTHFPH